MFQLFQRITDKMIIRLVRYGNKAIARNGPKRIILIRHGESIANIDPKVYARLPDNKIPLSPFGFKQAHDAGYQLKKVVGDESITFYVSPFLRTRQTYEEIIRHFQPNKHIMIEDPRIREQERGNYQRIDNVVWEEREEIGAFYYRFEKGESVADVYDRCSSFLETLFRDNETISATATTNKVLICHGGFMRLFLMRYFKWTVDKFHSLKNPDNCEIWVLEREKNSTSYKKITPLRFY